MLSFTLIINYTGVLELSGTTGVFPRLHQPVRTSAIGKVTFTFTKALQAFVNDFCITIHE